MTFACTAHAASSYNRQQQQQRSPSKYKLVSDNRYKAPLSKHILEWLPKCIKDNQELDEVRSGFGAAMVVNDECIKVPYEWTFDIYMKNTTGARWEKDTITLDPMKNVKSERLTVSGFKEEEATFTSNSSTNTLQHTTFRRSNGEDIFISSMARNGEVTVKWDGTLYLGRLVNEKFVELWNPRSSHYWLFILDDITKTLMMIRRPMGSYDEYNI